MSWPNRENLGYAFSNGDQERGGDRTFYEQLVAAGKKPLQALVAVMRKLLHAIYGMLRTNTDFDGSKFRRLPHTAAAPAAQGGLP